jgi:hypothetical protein
MKPSSLITRLLIFEFKPDRNYLLQISFALKALARKEASEYFSSKSSNKPEPRKLG